RVSRAHGFLLKLAPAAIVGVAVYGLVGALRLGISPVAAAVLALGFAAVVLRVPANLFVRVRQSARWQLPVVMTLFAVWAFAEPSMRRVVEQRARRALPPSDTAAPNVLLIIWDTARAMSMSLHGHTRRTTPELEQFGKTGTVFEHAFATSAWSLPSHASLYTGRYPQETSVGRTAPLDESQTTLGEALARRGYVTAGFTANLFYGSRDFGIARGFDWYDDEVQPTLTNIAGTWSLTRRLVDRWRAFKGDHQDIVRRPASDVTDKLLRWIDRRGSRPFFTSVNYFDPHAPYLPPAPFRRAFTSAPPRYWFEEDPHATNPKHFEELRTAYETCVLYVDSELGRLLAALRQRGVLDNTLVIVTSDHGEEFGSHGNHLIMHERSLYATVLRIPLVMVLPGRVPSGVRRPEVVSLRDIPITVMDVLGGHDEEQFPGISLLRYATGSVSDAEVAEPRMAHLRPNKVWPKSYLDWAIRKSHVFSLASGTLHYIVNASGEEELYDFVRDPWETVDLARDRTTYSALARFRATLDRMAPGWQTVSADTIAY
ncbi:MAG: sulfatase-like hydrolase/transferase, partial [Gemmatimonadaceae bacterium]